MERRQVIIISKKRPEDSVAGNYCPMDPDRQMVPNRDPFANYCPFEEVVENQSDKLLNNLIDAFEILSVRSPKKRIKLEDEGALPSLSSTTSVQDADSDSYLGINDKETLANKFFNENRNPISRLTEFCRIIRKRLTFIEVGSALDSRCSLSYTFVARIDGVDYPRGRGKTKKRAKSDAALKALMMLLDKDVDDLEEFDTKAPSTVIFDSFGRKCVLSENPKKRKSEPWAYLEQVLESQNHPVDSLKSFCQRQGWSVLFDVAYSLTKETYTCRIDVNCVYLGREEAHSKNLALRKASEKALKALQQYVSTTA